MSYLRVGIRVTPPSKPPKSHLEEVKFEVSSLTSKTSCKKSKDFTSLLNLFCS